MCDHEKNLNVEIEVVFNKGEVMYTKIATNLGVDGTAVQVHAQDRKNVDDEDEKESDIG